MLAAFERRCAQHDVVLFSDYGKGGLTHIPTMIERARAAGKPVLVDPKGSDYARYPAPRVITPNRAELRAGDRRLERRGELQRARAGAARDRSASTRCC